MRGGAVACAAAAAAAAAARLLVLFSAPSAAVGACEGAAHTRPEPLVTGAVTHVNRAVNVDLRPVISIEDGCEVLLPIDVPLPILAVDSEGAIPVESITSLQPDGVYGVGDHLVIDVHFSANVTVYGEDPRLSLQTGCHSEDCSVKEVQKLRCLATQGVFSLGFNGDFAPNVAASTSPEGLKLIIEGFDGIDNVHVEYSNPDGTRTACSRSGNDIIITFLSLGPEAVSENGNVHPLTADYWNAPINPFTWQRWGEQNRLWVGHDDSVCPDDGDLSFGGVILDEEGKQRLGNSALRGVELSQTAEEVVQGFQLDDALAVYVGGNGTSVLNFLYVVRPGDKSSDLDYSSTTALVAGPIGVGGIVIGSNGQAANLTLPAPGDAANYRLGRGMSLSASKNIIIDSSPPKVIQVTSPDADRSYGTGEHIDVHVVFNKGVVVDTAGGFPELQLETGLFDQFIPFVGVEDGGLVFEYTVAEGDSSSDLDYRRVDSLHLNGAIILEATMNPQTEADSLLPLPGGEGSLSYENDIIVRPTTPNALDVRTFLADGAYGAGHEILIDVSFGWWDDEPVPIEISGSEGAILLLEMESKSWGELFSAIPGSNLVVAAEGHRITEAEVGQTFNISGEVHVLNSTDGNLITLSGPWLGPVVSGGSPELSITSSGSQIAGYVEGNGTSVLTFSYVVQPGDETSDLEYTGIDALQPLLGGNFRRLAERFPPPGDINVALPLPYSCVQFKGCSLGNNGDITIDTRPPSVLEVSTTKPSGQAYAVGESIDVSVVFDMPVVVDFAAPGTPRLKLSTLNYAEYWFGSGTNTLTFSYAVGDDDIAPVLDVWDAAAAGSVSALEVAASGVVGYIRRASTFPTTDAILQLPLSGEVGSLSSSGPIVIDAHAPQILGINTTDTVAGAVYGVGQRIELNIIYSEPVAVNGIVPGVSPSIELNSGGTAVYHGGSGSSVLNFLYDVEEGEWTQALDVQQSTGDLFNTTRITLDGANITSMAWPTDLASTSLPVGSLLDFGLVIDSEPPVVVSVWSDHPDGIFGVGEEFSIFAIYNAPVLVEPIANISLLLSVSDDVVSAPFLGYRNGSDLQGLEFLYIVGPGEYTSDLDYFGASALMAPPGTIRRLSSNSTQAASMLLPVNGQPGSLGINGNIRIDSSPAHINAITTANILSSPQLLTGKVQTLDVIGSDGNFALRFRNSLTICLPALSNATDIQAALDATNSAIVLSVSEDEPPAADRRRFRVMFEIPAVGVAMLELATGEAQCEGMHTPVLVNREIPTVPTGVLHFAVGMSRPVSLEGNMYLELVMDGGHLAKAMQGPGLVQYIDVGVNAAESVTAGYFRLQYEGVMTSCIDIHSVETATAIHSFRGALESVPAMAALGIKRVSRAALGNGFRFEVEFELGMPSAISVPSNPVDGCAVPFEPPTFNHAVDILVPPLETLNFFYELQPNDTSSSLSAGPVLQLLGNGSSLTSASSAASQAADLSLPASQAIFGSFSVDCLPPPTVISVRCTGYSGNYGAGQRLYYVVEFDADVTVLGQPLLSLNAGGGSAATYYSGSGTRELSFRYSVIPGHDTSDLGPYSSTALTSNGGTIMAESRPAVAADLRLPASFVKSADGGAIAVNTDAPVVLEVYTNKASGDYGVGEEVVVTVQFSEAVDVVGTPSLPLSSGGSAYYSRRGVVQSIVIAPDDDLDFSLEAAQVMAGSFRLKYGEDVTACSRYDDVDSLANNLKALPGIGNEGIHNVTLTSLRGGLRFDVEFSFGEGGYESYPLELEVPWNWYEGCEPVVPENVRPVPYIGTGVRFLYMVSPDESATSLFPTGNIALADSGDAIRRFQSQGVTNANTTLPAFNSSWGISIDTEVARVVRVAAVENGTFGFRDLVEIAIDFDHPIVAFSGELDLVLGSWEDRVATRTVFLDSQSMGIASPSILFSFTVGESEATADLTYAGVSALSGEMYRASSNPSDPCFLLLPSSGLANSLDVTSEVIIASNSSVTSVYSLWIDPPEGQLGVGDMATVHVEFTRSVYFYGEVFLVIAVGEDEVALEPSAPLPTELSPSISFIYTVRPADSGQILRAVSLDIASGSYVRDLHGLDIDSALPTDPSRTIAGTSNVVVDTTSTIEWVSSPLPDGTYYAGESIWIQVHYNAPVRVIGSPLMVMSAGEARESSARAHYVNGSGSNDLLFEYIVREGDGTARLGYEAENSLFYPTSVETSIESRIVAAHDASIIADTTLPENWLNSQLRAQAFIKIFTGVPEVTSVTTDAADGSYGVGSEILFNVHFTTRICVESEFQLPYLELGIIKDARDEGHIVSAQFESGNLTDTLIFRYLVDEGDTTELLDFRDTRTWKRQKFSEALIRPPGVKIRAASVRPTTDALLLLPLPGALGSLSATSTIVIDTSRPTIRKVWVLNPDGVYSTGDVLSIGVQFSHPVVLLVGLSPSAATPSLLLALDSYTDEPRAIYQSGNETDTLVLAYTILYGDDTPLLDYVDEFSFSMYRSRILSYERKDAAIRRVSTNPTQDADLTLPRPGPRESILGATSIVGSGSHIAVQGHTLRVERVTSPMPDGIYPLGSLLELVVSFSVPVVVVDGVDAPTLLLAMDQGPALAYYAGGSGTSNLVFMYVVQDGDEAADLDYIEGVAPINATYGSILSEEGGEAIYLGSLPRSGEKGSLSYERNIAVSADVSFVSQVWTPLPDGIYGAGEVVDIYVSFSSMMIAEDPETTALILVAGSNEADVVAPFHDYDNSTLSLIFRYQVSEGDFTLRLGYRNVSSLLGNLYFNSAFASSVPSLVRLPAPGMSGSLSADHIIAIDTTAPQVIAVGTTTADGAYTSGSLIDIIVEWSAPVVFNSPDPQSYLSLVTGGFGGIAHYISGNGTAKLIYRYAVGLGGDTEGSSDLDYADVDALAAVGLLRQSTRPITPANSILPHRGMPGSLGFGNSIVIDVGAARVLNVTSDHADGVYGTGELIHITLQFSESVFLSGASSSSDLQLRVNAGTDAVALYCCGSGTRDITFTYTVQSGHSSEDLDYLSEGAVLLLNGAEVFVESSLGRSPMIALPAPGIIGSLGYNSDIVIDGRGPWITDISSTTPNGEWGAGEEIELLVTFSSPVFVPYPESAALLLDVGPGGIRECPYLSGNGTTVIFWLYIVSEGDQSYDLSMPADMGFSDGTIILRMSTNPSDLADLTLPGNELPGSLVFNKDIVIDTSRPAVEHVVSGREGTFTVGQMLDFQLIFDKPVVVTGVPFLAVDLVSNGNDLSILAEYDPTFASRTILSPSRVLSFTYIIGPQERAESVSHSSIESLILPDSTVSIRRNSTTPTTDALLNLPPPPSGGLLTPVYAVEAAAIGLAHHEASDLVMELIHQGRSSILAFGGSSGERSGPQALQGDYHFADEVGVNLASDPRAFTLQSSTAYGGASQRAVDGCTKAAISDDCSSLTELEVDPWWEVVLPELSRVSQVHIYWGGEEESPREEVQILSIRARTPLRGSFVLSFQADPSSAFISLQRLDVSATPDELQHAIMDVAGPTFAGISIIYSAYEVPGSYHRSWTIRFDSGVGDVPQLEIQELELSSSSPVAVIETLQQGVEPGAIYWEGTKHRISFASRPAWLLLFADEESALASQSTLEDARAAAASERYLGVRDGSTLESVVDMGLALGQVLRIHVDGKDRLSLAEVQLFAVEFQTLADLSEFKTVPPRPSWNPLLASTSLGTAFQTTTTEGTWTLRILDRVLEKYNEEPSKVLFPYLNGAGSISGWTLSLSDLFGATRTFTMDFYATVEAIPLHGRLTTLDGQEILPARGFESDVAICPSRLLPNSTILDSSCLGIHQPKLSDLSSRGRGDISARNRIRGENHGAAVVLYTPDEDYRGTDVLYYSVTVGGIKSTTAGRVDLSTGNCRMFERGVAHPLCSCSLAGLNANSVVQESCLASLNDVCNGDEEVGLGRARLSATERLHADMGARMCLACGSDTFDFQSLSDSCIAESRKLGTYLHLEGFCQDTFEIPICDDEMLPGGRTFETVPRTLALHQLKDWQTDHSKVLSVSEATNMQTCVCSQPYEDCPCMRSTLVRQSVP